MKSITTVFSLFSITLCQSYGEVLLIEDFEDLSVNFTPSTPLFHDGTSDYLAIVPSQGVANPVFPFVGQNGLGYLAAEDLDDGGTRPDTATLTFTVGIIDYENLNLGLLFAAGGQDGIPGYDTNDGVLIRASIDGGTFQNLLAFEAIGVTNAITKQDADFDGLGDAAGFEPTSTFSAFDNLAIAGTGTELVVELIITSNDGNGEYAFDDIEISGDLVPEPSSTALLGLGGLALLMRRRK